MASFLPNPSRLASVPPVGSQFPHVMLVDMDSFFASVEQQANPLYRGRPLGVCASLHRGSSLIAASREAKRLGIRTGTPNWKARAICPDMVFVEAEPQKYRQVNRLFNRILDDYSDRIEHYSIDESFLDLRGSRLGPVTVGTEIKRRLKEEVGEAITCSIGIAPNKFMAKLAAHMQKPNGLGLLWREQLAEAYRGLKFTDLWGIARGWERRLNKLGLSSPAEVLDYPLPNIIAAYGKPGYYIWHRINGLEVDEIDSAEDPPKSFGHSWVLNFRSLDKRRIEPVIMRLAEKAARRMRRGGFKARGIYLTIRESGGGSHHQSKRLDFELETGIELFEQAKVMWRAWKFKSEVSQVAVGFFGLVERREQLSLFGQGDKALNDSLDLINDKYGEFTIRPGTLTDTQDYAPDAIAFGK